MIHSSETRSAKPSTAPRSAIACPKPWPITTDPPRSHQRNCQKNWETRAAKYARQKSSTNLKKYLRRLPAILATHIAPSPSNALELLRVHVMGIDPAGSDALVVRR